MKRLAVIQHNSSEYLGLMEDHLEGRGTRFQYYRPFTSDGKLPDEAALNDGLILLGGGPWGCAGHNNLPTLRAEIALTELALRCSVPVVGIGLGAHILALACGGAVKSAPLRMRVDIAARQDHQALAGLIPEAFPVATYLRDRIALPDDARVLATLPDEDPAIWQIGKNSFGFAGHPGLKPGMVEDLIMEFEESPVQVNQALAGLGRVKTEIADALVPLMTGLVRDCDWM